MKKLKNGCGWFFYKSEFTLDGFLEAPLICKNGVLAIQNKPSIFKMRNLQIFRDGRKHTKFSQRPIPPGAKGNFETLEEMKKIVFEDSQENDLKNFVLREIVGQKSSLREQLQAIFLYARDRIRYEPERDGYETVADLWSCLYSFDPKTAIGDCVQKSIFIATCLSYLGFNPFFSAIQQIPNADFFNHVYVECEINGNLTVFDATPPNFQIGDEGEFYNKMRFYIFE